MDPGTIDLSFVPVPRAGLAPVAVGDELLIVDDGADRPHLLSPTASLVWSFMDGTGSLGDFAADLVAELGADPRRVQADLVDLARELGRRGLLEGIDGDQVIVPGAAAPDGRLGSPANAALDARFDRPDARTTTVRDGPVELDLRVDDLALAGEVNTALAAAGLTADRPRPTRDPGPSAGPGPLYSVLLGRPTGPVTGLHLIYRSARSLRRCRGRDDLVRILVADVVAVLDRQAGRRPLLDAVGLSRGGRLVAVDPQFAAMVGDLEPRLRRDGVAREDASYLALPPNGPHVVLAGVVLRPSNPGPSAAPTPASVVLGAVDLARGVDGRVSPEAVARLGEVMATTVVRRTPGRDGLRAEVLDLLS